jgi:hypothetical protein
MRLEGPGAVEGGRPRGCAAAFSLLAGPRRWPYVPDYLHHPSWVVVAKSRAPVVRTNLWATGAQSRSEALLALKDIADRIEKGQDPAEPA